MEHAEPGHRVLFPVEPRQQKTCLAPYCEALRSVARLRKQPRLLPDQRNIAAAFSPTFFEQLGHVDPDKPDGRPHLIPLAKHMGVSAASNSVSSSAIPLVDAISDSVTLPGGTTGWTYNVASNDEYASGPLPSGAVCTVEAGTTCTNASISGSGYVRRADLGLLLGASPGVRELGCDRAHLGVFQIPKNPDLNQWGVSMLAALMAVISATRVRRMSPSECCSAPGHGRPNGRPCP